MKQYIFLLVFSLCLFTCSPKIKENIIIKAASLNDKTIVVVLDQHDYREIKAKKIGEIKVVDNGLSENCSYYENLKRLKASAKSNGANLVKITKYKSPDNWSTCHRFWADIYNVENSADYETVIYWSSDRKLNWSDFKGIPDQKNFPDKAAITDCGFEFEFDSPKLFKEERVFFVQAKFITETSWVLPNSKSDYILNHEQLHFDIAEIFCRKLRKELTEAKITNSNLERANDIFRNNYKEFKAFQELYDYETKHGLDSLNQEQWNVTVDLELIKYNPYKYN